MTRHLRSVPESRDWDAPLRIDPIVEQWGLRSERAARAEVDPAPPGPPRPRPPDTEDYESLGHTFLHGRGNRHDMPGEVSTGPGPEPAPPVDWYRLFLWAFVAGCFVLAGMLWWIGAQILHRINAYNVAQATHPSETASAHVFAVLFAAGVFVWVLRNAIRWLNGRR